MFFRLPILIICLSCISVHAAEIKVVPSDRPGQGAIFVEGDIKYEDKEQFLTKIAPFSSGLVIFNSRGGSAYAGIEIGKAIRMRNFDTWVPSGSFCASACAIAWLGGTHRLMGKSALIGFHSVYRVEGGATVETGSGNAIYGAYLSQLGLSDRAIAYLSDAAPTSMNWLTPAQAENYGIDLAIFDLNTNQIGAKPAPSEPKSLEARSRDFIIALHVLISGPDEQFLKILNGIYADQVFYFGKQLPRDAVISQLTKFLTRWPVRSYVVRPDSLKVQCNGQTSECHIEGLLDFDAKSLARKQWSHGLATFDYLVSFRPNYRWPIILDENGSLVNRQIEVLDSTNSGPLPSGNGSTNNPNVTSQTQSQPMTMSPSSVVTKRIKDSVSLGYMNLRAGPGRDQAVIARVPAGTSGITVSGPCIPAADVESRYLFCPVKWNGYTGWISSSGLE